MSDHLPAALQQPGAVSYQAADTALYTRALADDGYGWLARILPPPAPLSCPRCRRPMTLPQVRLLWQCPACDTPEGENTT